MPRTRLLLPALFLLSAAALALAASPVPTPMITPSVEFPAASAQNSSALPPPTVNITNSTTRRFETNPILSLPGVFVHQITPGTEVPPESLIDQRYLLTRNTETRTISLKEAIYIAIRNNPGLAVTQLDPLAAIESIKQANAAFDPDLTAQLDVSKQVAPVSSVFQVRGSDAFTQKFYDWNFGINKVLANTNGVLGLTFDNNRSLTNSTFASVNPSYTPSLQMSLVQPLLRNFGWDFARLNVHLAESAQRTAQWSYGSALNDFVERIANDYWGVVGAIGDLQVAQSALAFNRDLVRVNRVSVNVGTLAPIDLQEAQSAASTAEAALYRAQAALRSARVQLRQDVMLNPQGTFIPEDVEPDEKPNPNLRLKETEEGALQNMVEYSPALGRLRESIRTALLQVKFAENQTLPQMNLGAQFGVTSIEGKARCTSFGSAGGAPVAVAGGNCDSVPGVGFTGTQLPFGGSYSDALNHMLDARFYNYAAVLNFEMPLDNAAAKAALAQARISYESARLQYRAAIAQAVVNVESALANLQAGEQRARATADAVSYANKSLADEKVRFKVGMATTHDLLQFQNALVLKQGDQVAANVDLENARIALWHAEGTLLGNFGIDFQPQDARQYPWYSLF